MNEMALGYKGNRRDKDDNFYQVHEIGWEYATKYFPCFKQEGYEADDWAGALYREVRDGTDDSSAITAETPVHY